MRLLANTKEWSIRNTWIKSGQKAKQFFTKSLSRQSGVAKCAVRNFKNGKNICKNCTEPSSARS